MNPKLIPCHCIKYGRDEISSLLDSETSSSQFIKHLKEVIQAKYIFLVDSGRSGLYLILKALNLTKKKVMTSAYTSEVVPKTIRISGYIPSPIEIETKHIDIDVNFLKNNLDKNVGVIMVTHLFGLPVPMKPIKEIAEKKDLFIIEDCANSLGSICDGKPTGILGNIAFFSFRFGKPLSSGGGAICTNDDELANKITTLSNELRPFPALNSWIKTARIVLEAIMFQPPFYGVVTRPTREFTKNTLLGNMFIKGGMVDTGYQPTFKTIHEMPRQQIAIALARIRKLDEEIRLRRKMAETYYSELERLPLEMPTEPDNGKSNHLAFPLILDEKVDLISFIKYLRKNGIDTARFHHHVPLSQFSEFGYIPKNFPNTERLCNSLVAIPIGPALTTSQQQYVCETIRGFFKVI